MRHLKFFLVLILSILTVFSSCEKVEKKVEIETSDNLEQFGILGKWKLETRTINGITDLSIQCCDYIIFKPDSEPDNLKGEFTASGVGYETNGVFELNPSNSIIYFNYDNSQKSYEFQISDNLTTFTYNENNQEIIEDWRKEE
ncbi:MAG: hypothetical protein IH598_01045 [Bacteroidales bacterium]|nr:hypothetical protein [Bacteroidales bacterium]